MTAPVTMPSGIKIVEERPPGSYKLGVLHGETEKAVQFLYNFGDGDQVPFWFPKKDVVRLGGTQTFFVYGWALREAMEYYYGTTRVIKR